MQFDDHSTLVTVKLNNHPEKENTNNIQIVAKTAIIKSIERCPIDKANLFNLCEFLIIYKVIKNDSASKSALKRPTEYRTLK